ncbi:MAG: hypothetical protein NC548_51660 [Lachnospiraceae bacterium]|nr:hypothetical protein [Lachnospiraceae bacterium]MCM1231664.1 hypothetical protein [Ruminococcus flavefaciens]
MLENESKLVSETALVIDDDYDFDRRIGVVFSKERKWENFLETDYKCSDGTSVKNRELPDGRRMSEFYDSVMGEYECNVFDEQGTLLVKDKCDRNGNYETAERLPDGTLHEESGTSIFIRCVDGKMI